MRRALLALLLIACGDPPVDTDAGTDAFVPPPFDAGTRPTVLPEETADVAALDLLTDLAALPVLGVERRQVQQSSEDRLLGGSVSTTLLENGNRDMNHFVCLGEGSDFESPNLVLERFDMETCPEPYVRGAVMSRFEGSGALEASVDTDAPAAGRLHVQRNETVGPTSASPSMARYASRARAPRTTSTAPSTSSAGRTRRRGRGPGSRLPSVRRAA